MLHSAQDHMQYRARTHRSTLRPAPHPPVTSHCCTEQRPGGRLSLSHTHTHTHTHSRPQSHQTGGICCNRADHAGSVPSSLGCTRTTESKTHTHTHDCV
ncbi:hypothetical protein AALO_G00273040 [Alosa alosa]|uniref:Uncharacterized protein n=1 Tax=Alosa alosa TaxID=278164 RepID=A0AAV6FMY9_9TELE|nr:hypothetical protein AALO_G00273040 [Alosa alosa]